MDESDLGIEDIKFNENEIVTLPENLISEAPLNLIEFQGKNFILNEKALNFLKSIEEEVIVVSIVGKARTGKSYLMNLLLNNIRKIGFDVGSTINSCTRGIWIWGNTRNKQGSNTKIIFLDSEGTSSADISTKTTDSKIFALVVLISSLMIYNTTVNIDEKSISDLSLAAHLSTSIAVSSSVDKDSALTELAPRFIWVIRDFSLEKLNPETGEEISSNEYLEMCLKNKISGRNSVENNHIRENIIKYFQHRECVTLPRPVESEEELRNLNQISFDQLKPNFRNEFINLRSKVYTESNVKKINGIKLTGKTLALFLTEFINSINTGVVPNINNAWDNVISTDIESYYEKAIKFYKESIRTPIGNLISFLYDIKFKTILLYDKVLDCNIEVRTIEAYNEIYQKFKHRLLNEIATQERRTMNEDKDHWNKKCLDTLRKENKDLQSGMFNNKYTSDNGFSNLREDLITTLLNFDKQTQEDCHTDERLKVLLGFLSNQTREVLYYMATNISENTNDQLRQISKEKQILCIEETPVSENKKLIEINKILETRVKHLEADKQKKMDTISSLNTKLQELDTQLKTKSYNGVKRNKKFDNNINDLRLSNHILSSETRDCDCKCILF